MIEGCLQGEKRDRQQGKRRQRLEAAAGEHPIEHLQRVDRQGEDEQVDDGASYEEAARIDGASEIQLLWQVFIPLSKPALATIALLSVVTRWNGYFWSMVLLRSEEKIPLQVYLKKMVVDLRSDDSFASKLMTAEFSFETITAAIMVASLVPIVLVYPYLQKHFAKGIMLGGVKE
jgi:putative aldouronate transport system permease protein